MTDLEDRLRAENLTLHERIARLIVRVGELEIQLGQAQARADSAEYLVRVQQQVSL